MDDIERQETQQDDQVKQRGDPTADAEVKQRIARIEFGKRKRACLNEVQDVLDRHGFHIVPLSVSEYVGEGGHKILVTGGYDLAPIDGM